MNECCVVIRVGYSVENFELPKGRGVGAICNAGKKGVSGYLNSTPIIINRDTRGRQVNIHGRAHGRAVGIYDFNTVGSVEARAIYIDGFIATVISTGVQPK